jgi:hypothetical protein
LIAIRSAHPRGFIFNVGPIQTTGIVTRLSVEQSVAAQFQPSLNKVIYATPFGDNVGTLTVEVVLNTECGSSQDSASQFLSHYASTRFSPDNTERADLIIGQKAFTGYAVAFNLTASSDTGNTVQGVLKFVAWMTL